MRTKFWTKCTLGFLCSLVLFSSAKGGNSPMLFEVGRLDFDLSKNYLFTTANHDDQGNTFTKLGSGQSFNHWNFDLAGRYGLSPRMSLFGNMAGAYARSIDEQFERASSGLTDFGGGVNYLVWHRHVLVNAELFGSAPVFTVNPQTDEVLLGEGSTNLGARLLVGKNFRYFRLYGYTGMISRSEGRSTLIPWGLVFESRFRFWILESTVRGYDSLGDDQYTDTPSERTNVTDAVNGGSLRFYSVNPSLMEFEIVGGYKIAPKTSLLVGYGMTLTGARSASGSSFMASLRYYFGESRAQRLRRMHHKKWKERSSRNVKDFETETDETDLELFEMEEERLFDPDHYDKLLEDAEKQLEGKEDEP